MQLVKRDLEHWQALTTEGLKESSWASFYPPFFTLPHPNSQPHIWIPFVCQQAWGCPVLIGRLRFQSWNFLSSKKQKLFLKSAVSDLNRTTPFLPIAWLHTSPTARPNPIHLLHKVKCPQFWCKSRPECIWWIECYCVHSYILVTVALLMICSVIWFEIANSFLGGLKSQTGLWYCCFT